MFPSDLCILSLRVIEGTSQLHCGYVCGCESVCVCVFKPVWPSGCGRPMLVLLLLLISPFGPRGLLLLLLFKGAVGGFSRP